VKKNSDKINDIIFSIITSGKLNIKMNEQLFFQYSLGCEAGIQCPLFYFYLTVDSMSVMIKKVHEYNLITCLIPHLAKNGIAILQYADDILFLSNERFENARNFKFKLSLFEQM
jgi:hypothetical protein